jgi:hypothetical protein
VDSQGNPLHDQAGSLGKKIARDKILSLKKSLTQSQSSAILKSQPKKYMYKAFGTPLRSNYSFSQVTKDCWQFDDGFESLSVNYPSLRQWWGTLKIAGKTIKMEGIDQDVIVEGVKLTFAQRLNLLDYIKKNLLPAKKSNAVYNGRGELIPA